MANFETPALRPYPIIPKLKEGVMAHSKPFVAKEQFQKPLGFPGGLVDNWQDVAVVIDPADYPRVLAELKSGAIGRDTKFRLAAKVYAHTAAYDGMIASYLTALPPGAEAATASVPERIEFPAVLSLQLRKTQDIA